MKIFKNWKEGDIPSFVMFLAKEAQRQKRRMRHYHQRLAKQGETDSINAYQTQQGQAAEADMLFVIAKDHFNFHKRKSQS